ncbi:hypothetical protein F2P81_022569 [Scophthalmus maximus]|uniref:Uncharacterized protein n=1 Tax=Scophthalmus maximus TaxID=52904 RepID=A0A6A4S0M9_SCOMX|nr:hypothetical protein F2P81_022569 [Scophthalmus maximus]
MIFVTLPPFPHDDRREEEKKNPVRTFPRSSPNVRKCRSGHFTVTLDQKTINFSSRGRSCRFAPLDRSVSKIKTDGKGLAPSGCTGQLAFRSVPLVSYEMSPHLKMKHPLKLVLSVRQTAGERARGSGPRDAQFVSEGRAEKTSIAATELFVPRISAIGKQIIKAI